MKQYQRILLLDSSGYLGKTLTTLLQQSHFVHPTHRTKAYFVGSYPNGFWTDVPSNNLQSSSMPLDFPYPKDTSLNTNLMKKLTGIEAISIDQALRRYA